MVDTIDIQTVEEWDYNKQFRYATEKAIDRLDKHSKYGQHSTLLLYFSPDGRIITLGGNKRLRRWKNDPNYQQVKYIKLEFGQDEQGFYPILDGQVYRDQATGAIPYHFKSVEQGMIALAMSHNGVFASDINDEVANMVGNFPDIDWSMHTAHFIDPVTIGDLYKEQKNDQDGAYEDPLVEKNVKIIITVASLGVADQLKEKLDQVLVDFPDVEVKVKG